MKHQTIIDNLITRLKTITKANGYSQNLNNRVYSWYVWKAVETIDESELPVVDVRDADPVQVTWAGYFEYEMPIDISIYLGGGTSKAEARQIVYDVYAALNTDRTLSGVADEIFPQSYQLAVDQNGKLIAGVKIQIAVKFHTAQWDED